MRRGGRWRRRVSERPSQPLGSARDTTRRKSEPRLSPSRWELTMSCPYPQDNGVTLACSGIVVPPRSSENWVSLCLCLLQEPLSFSQTAWWEAHPEEGPLVSSTAPGPCTFLPLKKPENTPLWFPKTPSLFVPSQGGKLSPGWRSALIVWLHFRKMLFVSEHLGRKWRSVAAWKSQLMLNIHALLSVNDNL